MALNTDKLRRFADKLAHARKEALGPDVASMLRGTVIKLLADQFNKSVDPYGRPWKPVQRMRKRDRAAKKRETKKHGVARPDKPLVDSGRMRKAATAAVVGDKVIARIPVAYSQFHQGGTRHMVARKMVPDAGQSVKWTTEIQKDVTRFLKERLG